MCSASLHLALDSHCIPFFFLPQNLHNAKAHSTLTHTTWRHRGVNTHETSLGQWRTQWRNLSSFCSQAGKLHFVRFLKSIEQKWFIAVASLSAHPWNGFLCFLLLVPQSCTSATCRSQINHLDANCLRALLPGKFRWRQLPYWITG